MPRFFTVLLLCVAVLMGSFGESGAMASTLGEPSFSNCTSIDLVADADQGTPDGGSDTNGSKLSHGCHHHCSASLIAAPQDVPGDMQPQSSLRIIVADATPPSHSSDPLTEPPAA